MSVSPRARTLERPAIQELPLVRWSARHLISPYAFRSDVTDTGARAIASPSVAEMAFKEGLTKCQAESLRNQGQLGTDIGTPTFAALNIGPSIGFDFCTKLVRRFVVRAVPIWWGHLPICVGCL
jgi:hypothetical protein